MMQLPKSYYLPAYRSVIIGIILMALGVGVLFIGVDFNASLWHNLQSIFLNFGSVFDFMDL